MSYGLVALDDGLRHHINMGAKRHIKLVVSDVHLGTGATLPDGGINPLEDFRKDDKFVEFLEYYTTGEYAGADVELVINGDFFDFLMAKTTSQTPYEIFENVAVYKIRRILRGHPKVINALKKFLDEGHNIKLIWGNHDAGLWWPAVQEEVRAAIGSKLEIMFTPYEFDGVRIEHGHQYEVTHEFDMDRIFLQAKGKKVLNYPFGSFFVAGFLAKLKGKRHYITQVVPFSKFLRWAFIFDFWFALIHGIHVIWFFIKMRFIHHPYRFTRLSKTLLILGEIFKRPDFVVVAKKVIKKAKCQILVLGHNHQATHRYFRNGSQYVNTGTWTDITSFSPGNLGRVSKPTYAFIEYKDGSKPGEGVAPYICLRVWRGKHKEWEEFEL